MKRFIATILLLGSSIAHAQQSLRDLDARIASLGAAASGRSLVYNSQTGLLELEGVRSVGPVVRMNKNGVRTIYGANAQDGNAVGNAILAAQSEAGIGDAIYCFASGTLSGSLGKSGETVWLAPGITLTSSGTYSIVSDSGSAMTFSIAGMGNLATTNAEGVSLTAASIVNIECRSISSSGASKAGIYTDNGSLVLNIWADQIKSTQYDGIWAKGGTINAWARIITAGDNTLEMGGDASFSPTVNVYVGTMASTNCAFHCLKGTFFVSASQVLQSQLSDNAVICGGGASNVASGEIVTAHLPSAITVDDSSTLTMRRTTIDCRAAGDGACSFASTGSILDNCTIIADSGQSTSIQTYGNPITLTIIGPLYANKPKDTDVTLSQIGTLNGS